MEIKELGVYQMANGKKACVDGITDQQGFCIYGAFGEKAAEPSCCDGSDRTLWRRNGEHCLDKKFNLVRKVG